jgi:hypothetical protein
MEIHERGKVKKLKIIFPLILNHSLEIVFKSKIILDRNSCLRTQQMHHMHKLQDFVVDHIFVVRCI